MFAVMICFRFVRMSLRIKSISASVTDVRSATAVVETGCCARSAGHANKAAIPTTATAMMILFMLMVSLFLLSAACRRGFVLFVQFVISAADALQVTGFSEHLIVQIRKDAL